MTTIPMVALWFGGSIGCSARVDCPTPGTTLATVGADTITCGEGATAIDWIELLAGRPVAAGDRGLALTAVATKFSADPAGTRAWLQRLRDHGTSLAAAASPDAAVARATRVWQAERGQDLITSADGELWGVQDRALAVWAHDDGEQLALTEADLEGWIRFASLCREAQGGDVLRISVADRVTVYNDLIERFDTGDRRIQTAMVSMGYTWPIVRDRWKSATYEEQQAWIQAAPLPPPMTATSLGYAEAVFETDLAAQVQVLRDTLGPFAVGGASEGEVHFR
ncbi:MAG: hypothetical protein ABMB14_36015 [Myxococcota bacterium]